MCQAQWTGDRSRRADTFLKRQQLQSPRPSHTRKAVTVADIRAGAGVCADRKRLGSHANGWFTNATLALLIATSLLLACQNLFGIW